MITLNSQQVTIDRLVLLEALRTNLEKHKLDYAQAVENYRVALIEDLNTALAQASNPSQNLTEISVTFKHPTSHEDQYVEMIEMFEMSTQDEVTLDGPAFRSYIKDQWSWKSGFEFLNSTYASKAGLAGSVGSMVKAGQALGGLAVLTAAQSTSLVKKAAVTRSEPATNWPFPRGSQDPQPNGTTVAAVLEAESRKGKGKKEAKTKKSK